MDAKNYLLYDYLDLKFFDPKLKDACRLSFASHAAYRTRVCALPDAKIAADCAWKQGAKMSEIELMMLVESIGYGVAYDNTLKLGLRYRKVPSELFEYEALSLKLDEIDAHMKSERGYLSWIYTFIWGDWFAGRLIN